jgi:DNA-binding transcriptional MerR regulator
VSSEEVPVKLYYRIGEVAEIVGVEPHVLRYWETEFRSIRPQKSRKGQRIYSRRDVDKLLKVKDLLYTHGFTIAGARKRLRETGLEPASAQHAPETGKSERLRTELTALRGDVVAMLSELDALSSGSPARGVTSA